MVRRQLSRLSVYDHAKLVALLRERQINEASVHKVYSALMRNPYVAWRDVPGLPKAAAALLEERFERYCTSRVTATHASADGEATKLVVELADGKQVEAVILTYDTTGRDGDSAAGNRRATLCVSSQVGCAMGCTFCATGTMGLEGDLTAGEIVEQLVHANRVTPIRNVVFMGMGEPLNNYDAVRDAVSLMTDGRYFALRRAAVTVSTVGVVPRMRQLAHDLPGVSLALSLHAPNQALRLQLVPSARAYKLDKIMTAVNEYQAQAKRPKVFVEYVMLAGVNDQPVHAHELGSLLAGRDAVVVNLIPWNPVHAPGIDSFAAPGQAAVAEFHRIMRDVYKHPCTIRQEKGQDVAAACGQLVIDLKVTSGRVVGGRGGCGGAGHDAAPGQGATRDIEELAGLGFARGGAAAILPRAASAPQSVGL